MTERSIYLSHPHRQALHARGLRDDTIEAAEIWTVTDKAQAGALLGWDGPGPAPSIVIPYFGQPFVCRLRPDHPRHDEHGKAIKYESARGRPGRLYIPTSHEVLEDLTVDLIITEAEFKALAIWQLGFPVIGAAGVWGFHDVAHHQGTNNWRLHPEFLGISLKGRRVIIVFDSDAATNPNVLLAEARLASLLTEAGATVLIARIPADKEEEKLGIDDYLAQPGEDPLVRLGRLLMTAFTADPFLRMKLLEADPDRVDAARVLLADESFVAAVYVASDVDRRLIAGELNRLAKVGTKTLQNLVAAFRRKLATADGRDRRRSLYDWRDDCTFLRGEDGCELIAECTVALREAVKLDRGGGQTESRFRVAVASPALSERVVTLDPAVFDDPRQMLPALEAVVGVPLRILPGRERLMIDAAKDLSEYAESIIYGHAGWTVLPDGRRVYLLPGGSVDANGLVDIEVDLGGDALAGYGFPAGACDPAAGFGSILGLLASGTTEVTIPTVGQALAAPLIPVLGRRRPLVHVRGYTGTLKTSYTVEVRRIYGAPSTIALTSWNSTANSLERILHDAKDCLVIVDDFKSAVVPPPVWTRFVQSYGDLTARARMTKSLGAAPLLVPRGLAITAGEELPEGQRSVMGRLLVVNVEPGWLSLEALSAVQADPCIPMGGRAWIQWLCANWDWFEENAENEIVRWREQFQQQVPAAHARTPDSLAVLMFTLDQFFTACGIVPSFDHDRWLEAAFSALVNVGKNTAGLTASAAPGKRFLELLAAMLRMGEASLQWVAPCPQGSWLPLGPRVGWRTIQEIWLDQDIAFNVVEQNLRRAGRSLGINCDGLGHALAMEGLLLARESDHYTVRRQTPDGRRSRVLVLAPKDLFLDTDGSEPQQAPAGPDGGPEIRK